MGLGVRAFLLLADGTFKRFPYARYSRLWQDDTERLPSHAGQAASFVVAYLETDDRQPVRVLSFDCRRLRFQTDGRIDANHRDRGTHLALSGFDYSSGRGKSGSVVSAQHVFIKRQHQHEFMWEPSQEQLQQIGRLIFGD